MIMSNEMKEIHNIENKYGPVRFRMGFSHLVDIGHRNLTDENVRESVDQIMAQGEEDAADSKIPVMTPEFQCEIVRCAAELAQFSIWTLFAYIKKYVEVSI